MSQRDNAKWFSSAITLLYEGEDGGVGRGVWCGGANRDNTKLRVVGEVYKAKIDGGAGDGLKEPCDELVGGGGAWRLDQGRNWRRTW